MSLDDCLRHVETFYLAPKAAFAVARDIEPDPLRAAIDRLAGVFTGGQARLFAPQAANEQMIREDVPTAERTKLYLGYPLPPAGDWNFTLARLAAFLLGRGPGARLVEQLHSRRAVAAEVSVRTIARQYGPSVSVIELVPAENVRPDDALAALDRAVLEPVTPLEIERARAGYRTAWLTVADSIVERSGELSLALQLHGSATPHLRHEEWVNAAAPQDIAEAVRIWHPENRRGELVYHHV